MTYLERGAVTAAPEAVTAVAAERGLGELIGSREGRAPGDAVGGRKGPAVVGGVCLVLLVLCLVVDASSSSNAAVVALMAPLVRILLVATVLSVGWTIRALIRGQRSWYLYAGGMVQKGRSGSRVVAWTEAAELKLVHSRRGDNVRGGFCYQMVSRGGPTLTIPLKARQGDRDAFIDQVLAAARAHHCPIA